MEKNVKYRGELNLAGMDYSLLCFRQWYSGYFRPRNAGSTKNGR